MCVDSQNHDLLDNSHQRRIFSQIYRLCAFCSVSLGESIGDATSAVCLKNTHRIHTQIIIRESTKAQKIILELFFTGLVG
jgi:hypothetical protein